MKAGTVSFPNAAQLREKKEQLAHQLLSIAGPESLPKELQFRTAIPKGWGKLDLPAEERDPAAWPRTRTLMVVGDPNSGAMAKIAVLHLENEISVDDWLRVLAEGSKIRVVGQAVNPGVQGEVCELLGIADETPGTERGGAVTRFSGIRDGNRIFYIVSGAPQSTYASLADELACISLFFELVAPAGKSYAEAIDERLIPTPTECVLLHPKTWRLVKEEIGRETTCLVWDRADKGVHLASLVFRSWPRGDQKEPAKVGVSQFLNQIESMGYALPQKVGSVRVACERFPSGELLRSPVFFGKLDYGMELIVWESPKYFLGVAVTSRPPAYSAEVWLNARRIFSIANESLTQVPGETRSSPSQPGTSEN